MRDDGGGTGFAWQQAIAAALPEYGFTPSEAQAAAMARYLERVSGYAGVRLVGERDPERLVRRHLGESLFLGACLDPSRFAAAGGVLDVGSGAGFPGLALALRWEGLTATLVEANGKKAGFLLQTVEELGLGERVSVRNEFLPRRWDEGRERWKGLLTLRALEHMEQAPAWLGRWMAPEAVAAFWIGRDLAERWRRRFAAWRWEEPRLIPASRERCIVLAQRPE